MASTFKTLTPDDVVNSRTLLHEQIPLTGSIVSGSYKPTATSETENNILTYTHGMFSTVYDYPYLSSSANNLFDITFGGAPASVLFTSSSAIQRTKKLSIYSQMAKVLYGYDSTGSIKNFDRDGNAETTSDQLPDGFFLSFSRLLVKDEIKKGTFRMKLGLQSSDVDGGAFTLTGTIADLSGALSPPGYKTGSPAGEFGVLIFSESAQRGAGDTTVSTNFPAASTAIAGLIFYQAGIVFLHSGLFANYSAASPFSSMATSSAGLLATNPTFKISAATSKTGIASAALDATISELGYALRRRIQNIEFQNTTELNSTIYFLRINNNEFNYSANPTYLSGSEIRVKGGNPSNSSVSYITTAGLYSPDNELLAVAKLSQPLKKTEEQSMILRVRLDY